MKSLVYKNPLISAIIINIIALIIGIYSILNRVIWVIPLLTFIGIANRKIIDNGKEVTKKKEVLISISFFLMIIIFLAFASQMNHLRDIEIDNRILR
jgi:hypothetical protein